MLVCFGLSEKVPRVHMIGNYLQNSFIRCTETGQEPCTSHGSDRPTQRDRETVLAAVQQGARCSAKESVHTIPDRVGRIHDRCSDRCGYDGEPKKPEEKKDPPNQGLLIVDARCVPQDICYTTDLGVLDEARMATEKDHRHSAFCAAIGSVPDATTFGVRKGTAGFEGVLQGSHATAVASGAQHSVNQEVTQSLWVRSAQLCRESDSMQ